EDVLRTRARGDVRHHMLHGTIAGRLSDLLEQVAAPPAGLGLRMGGDDELVRLLHRNGVLHGGERVAVDDMPGRGEPRIAKLLESTVEAPAGRRAARVLVDHVPLTWSVYRRDHDDGRLASRNPIPDRVEQLIAVQRLVRDHEDLARVAHRTTSSSPSFAVTAPPCRTACLAPGTPYSYGLPTTCGISSKLKTGGGEVTCHSSVRARHGLPGATGPNRQLEIML